MHDHRFVEGVIEGCGDVGVGIERKHPTIAPGRFFQMQEEAALRVLDSAGEGSGCHFRGLLPPGAGEVLVQDR